MANQYQLLQNAPITEALIDIRANTADVVRVEELDRLAEDLKTDFPNKEIRRVELLELNIKKQEKTTKFIDKGISGYVLRSEDGCNVLQLMKDRFTFSRLKPYLDWEHLKSAARPLWLKYSNSIEAVQVNRIAVRYINKIEIPANLKDFKEYFTAPPEIPEGVPQGLSSYLTKLVIPNHNIGASAIVHQVLEEAKMTSDGKLPDKLSVLLDIDTIKFGEYDPKGDGLWNMLDKLRVYKNDIFFHSITEKTLDQYK